MTMENLEELAKELAEKVYLVPRLSILTAAELLEKHGVPQEKSTAMATELCQLVQRCDFPHELAEIDEELLNSLKEDFKRVLQKQQEKGA